MIKYELDRPNWLPQYKSFHRLQYVVQERTHTPETVQNLRKPSLKALKERPNPQKSQVIDFKQRPISLVGRTVKAPRQRGRRGATRHSWPSRRGAWATDSVEPLGSVESHF